MNASEFLDRFVRRWNQKYNSIYPVSRAKHLAMLKRLLKTYGEADCFKFLCYYFDGLNDKFINDAGHTIVLFVSEATIGKIVSGLKKQEESKSQACVQK